MRTLAPMPAAEILLMATVFALVITMLIFARRFHALSNRLEIQLNTDRDQQNRLESTLQRMEAATKVVAENLADSVSRADATEGPDGAAADAALRTGDTAAEIHERQGTTSGN